MLCDRVAPCREPRFSAVVAEIGGILIGMATLTERYYPGWVGPLLAINDLFVVPDHRGRGIGKALLAGAAAEAVRRGAPFLELTVRKDNPARRLYRKAGFTPVRDAMTLVLAGSAFTSLAAGT